MEKCIIALLIAVNTRYGCVEMSLSLFIILFTLAIYFSSPKYRAAGVAQSV